MSEFRDYLDGGRLIKKKRQLHQKPTDEQLESRFRHHTPKGDQAQRYSDIRAKCLEMAKFIRDNTPCSPEQTRAINDLHDAMMHTNAAIAINE